METGDIFTLKWQCHEIFRQFFFFYKRTHRPLVTRLKCFVLKIRFRRDICEISDSAQTNTARSQTLRRQTLVGVLPASILSLEASSCLDRASKFV